MASRGGRGGAEGFALSENSRSPLRLGGLCVRFGARFAVMAEGATGPGAAALRAVENCGEKLKG
ncbi:MAG: hypothetical protein K2L59_09735 [Muribaculaceae bacterium]|nr:hypothetical protein [Muribaculaceae bacterium]